MAQPTSNEPIVRLADAGEMFALIDEARRTGRQIIPLFGSGISVDAGFPVAAHLCDYLVRLHWWLNLKGMGSVDSYLRRHPWPSRHDLNADLLSEKDIRHNFEARLRIEGQRLNRDAIFDELRRDAPTAAYSVKALFDEITGKRLLDAQPAMQERFDRVTGTIHGNTGYRSLLNYLCDRDGNLIDGFFDHFARHRHPTTTHQFVAFVVQLLRTRLILTTNFDTFVEAALRDEGLEPTVYEIAREGTVPSDQLLWNQQLAVVKLHGGAYALRTGFDLDERLGHGALAEYKRYFQPPGDKQPPLVVALGYSGSDRRVMDILSTHLQDWSPVDRRSDNPKEAAKETRILWISRDDRVPPLLTEMVRPYSRDPDSSPVRFCPYRDARMFLDELYQRLTWQHPVSRHHYRAITPLPRTPRRDQALLNEPDDQHPQTPLPARDPLDAMKIQDLLVDAPAFRKHMALCRGFIFCAQAEGSGSSSLLAKACRAMDRTHLTIWIDAAELRSRASLIGVIQESLYPYDRHLNRVTRPLLFHDVDYVLRERSASDSIAVPNTVAGWNARHMRAGFEESETPLLLDWVEDWEEVVALRWVANALRRGRYVLAIDSLGEFGSGHPASPREWATGRENVATPAQAVAASRQVDKAYAFFAKLLSPQYDLGESKILIAVTGNLQGTNGERATRTRALLENAALFGVRHYMIPPRQLAQPNADPSQNNCGSRGQEAVKALGAWISAIGTDSETARGKVKALVVLVACFARRPRSYAFMNAMLARIVANKNLQAEGSCLTSLCKAFKGAEWRHDPVPGSEPNVSQDLMRAREALGLLTTSSRARVDSDPGPAKSGNEQNSPVEFLLHEEGGFYWMHQAIRDDLFNAVAPPTNGAANARSAYLSRGEVAELLDGMANFFYEDVYERSQDSAAFMEYMFHRLASIEWEPDDGKRFKRCEWLVAAIESEKEKLLARGRLTVLLNHMRAFLSLLVEYARSNAASSPGVAEYRELLVRLLAAYAEIFVACGHPHEAMNYRLLQAQFLVENVSTSLRLFKLPPIVGIKTTMAALDQLKDLEGLRSEWDQPLISNARERREDLIADLMEAGKMLGSQLGLEATLQVNATRELVKSLRLVTDTMIDLAVALTEPILFSTLPPAQDGQSKNTFWERDADRSFRVHWGHKLFIAAADHAERLQGVCASMADVERLARARLRLIEHQLRDFGIFRFLGAAPTDRLRPPPERDKQGLQDIIQSCEDAIKALRRGPATSRRLRHKCYLYLSKARALSLLHNRHGAEVNYARAQAALSRSAGAAERTALGLAFMFHAECLLLDAERQEDKEALASNHREAEMLLQRARIAMEGDGRSENRWKVFHSYLSARLEWQRVERQSASGTALDTEMQSESLFVAMRYLVYAMTNSGMRSDRRTVLLWLYEKVKQEIRKIERKKGKKGAQENDKEKKDLPSPTNRPEAVLCDQSPLSSAPTSSTTMPGSLAGSIPAAAFPRFPVQARICLSATSRSFSLS
jgi:hypothetical protein